MASDLLTDVLAQPTAVGTLRRALASGRVHHAYLFDGPAGVGKERAAFGLAQALVCERRGTAGHAADAACGECSACKRAVPREKEKRPVHPDVVVIARALYEASQIGRRTPETQEISIDQIRTLVLARAAFPPHEGRAKVFIVRAAEELSQSAANALLKTLEEPGQKTHFILLSSQSDTLLPTIRSRTQRVRFGPLPDDVVFQLLVLRGVADAHAKEVARLSGGSMANALALSDPDETEAREAFVRRAIETLDAGDVGAALELAEDAKKTGKDALPVHILALASRLAERGKALTIDGAGDRDIASCAARYQLALAAILELDGNASAQLVVEAMLVKMRAA